MFKVGDKVRIKASVSNEELDNIAYPYEDVGRDDVYAIVDSEDQDPSEWTKLANGWYVTPDMLELASPTPAVEFRKSVTLVGDGFEFTLSGDALTIDVGGDAMTIPFATLVAAVDELRKEAK